LVVGASAVAASKIRAADVPTPKVVVLLTVDTLRADAVSFSGSGLKTTPFLEKVAKQGVVFERAYAASSWTIPSMASLFTSLAPASHGMAGFRGKSGSHNKLADSIQTLAESFKQAGFTTVGVPGNRLLDEQFGYLQGFDYFCPARGRNALEINWEVEVQLRRAFGDEWANAWKQQKTFLWIHYLDPHSPYEARYPWMAGYAPDFPKDADTYPVGMREQKIRRLFQDQFGPEFAVKMWSLYQSEVSFVDENIRRLFAHLGVLDDDVLLVMTVDHGEEIADRGDVGHGHNLYEEVVRVPLFFRWPGGIAGERRVRTPVSLLDLYPTIAALAGLTAPKGLQGNNLASILRADETPQQRPVFLHLNKPKRPVTGMVDGKWKLIVDQRDGTQLYDLETDRGEVRNTAAQNPTVVKRLTKNLDEWLGGLPEPPADGQSIEIKDEALLERLRALGYLDH
jgi:arylsulfatase A-like enzyme